MVVTTTSGGSVTNQNIAIKYFLDGMSPEDIMKHLKEQKYLVQLGAEIYKVNASDIASMVGIMIRVSDGLKSGVLKSTKTKGLFVA